MLVLDCAHTRLFVHEFAGYPRQGAHREDEFLLASQLEEILLDAGHSVVGLASHEAEAWALAESDPPTLAIIDLQLARGSDGARLALRLKQRFSTPIIVVSGYPPSLVDSACREIKPCAVLRKPISADEVLHAVSRCLSPPHLPGVSNR